eukprot:sb/3476792/
MSPKPPPHQELEVKLDTKHSSMEELVARLDTAERERNEALVAIETQQGQIGKDLAAMGQELETTRQYLETMEGSKMESEEALQVIQNSSIYGNGDMPINGIHVTSSPLLQMTRD